MLPSPFCAFIVLFSVIISPNKLRTQIRTYQFSVSAMINYHYFSDLAKNILQFCWSEVQCRSQRLDRLKKSRSQQGCIPFRKFQRKMFPHLFQLLEVALFWLMLPLFHVQSQKWMVQSFSCCVSLVLFFHHISFSDFSVSFLYRAFVVMGPTLIIQKNFPNSRSLTSSHL